MQWSVSPNHHVAFAGFSQGCCFFLPTPRGEGHLVLEIEMAIEGRCRRQSEFTARSGSRH